MDIQALRHLSIFAHYTEEQLQCTVEQGKEVCLNTGEVLFREGDPAKGVYVLLEGEVETIKRIGGQEVVLEISQPGAFVGEIALLTGSPNPATVHVKRASRLLLFEARLFHDAMSDSPIWSIVLSTMAQRLRSMEAHVQQQGKLLALGKLAAGLAHELNNPASAAARAAKQIREPLEVLLSLALKLGQLNLSTAQVKYLQELQSRLLKRATQTQVLDPLTQSDLEEQLASWIEEHGVLNGWKLVPMLVTAGLDSGQLGNLEVQVGASVLGDALAWLEGILTVMSLFRLLDSSTTRIFTLVQAVKAYSYLDQAPLQEIDIHEGLENTLLILGYQLNDITVTRKYDRSLPRITAYGSELNQVWTNLIDNAIDAMNGHGHLEIHTFRQQNFVRVEIADNGPGIPPEIQSRIFEPFFTTKPVGKGTGLGLEIAFRVVVERHHGTILFSSKSCDTRFEVCLPMSQS